MTINCEFTSVWDGETVITTACEYNPNTGEVTPEISEFLPDSHESLEREFIEMEDGDTIEVCTYCHKYVLKTVMANDNVGHGIHEELECSDPECESHRID